MCLTTRLSSKEVVLSAKNACQSREASWCIILILQHFDMSGMENRGMVAAERRAQEKAGAHGCKRSHRGSVLIDIDYTGGHTISVCCRLVFTGHTKICNL